MASAAAILAQAIPSLLNAFPGWKQPTHMKAQATIGAVGVATMVATETTLGVVIARSATSGQYTVTFPPCRRIADFVGNLAPATPTTGSEHRLTVSTPLTAAAAAAGTITVRTVEVATTTVLDPVTGATLDLSFWADLG